MLLLLIITALLTGSGAVARWKELPCGRRRRPPLESQCVALAVRGVVTPSEQPSAGAAVHRRFLDSLRANDFVANDDTWRQHLFNGEVEGVRSRRRGVLRSATTFGVWWWLGRRMKGEDSSDQFSEVYVVRVPRDAVA